MSNVIIGAPRTISEDLLKSFSVNFVLRDVSCLLNTSTALLKNKMDCEEDTSRNVTTVTDDPYAVPKRLGIYREVDSGCAITTSDIIKRIIDNR